MDDETVTTEGRKENEPTSHTTVIREKGSSGTGIVLAVILLIAVIGGFYLYSQSNMSEAAKDNAVADAAQDVGNAAGQVGDAADRAADSVEKQQ